MASQPSIFQFLFDPWDGIPSGRWDILVVAPVIILAAARAEISGNVIAALVVAAAAVRLA